MLQQINGSVTAPQERGLEDTPAREPGIEGKELAEAEVQEPLPHEMDWMARLSRPVPSHAAQVRLAQSIEAGVLAKGVLNADVRVSFGTPEEMAVLIREGEAAFEELLLGNLKLVLYWARRSSRVLDLADRFQYGFFGLRRAVERWDWRRGYTFSTYASWHVRQQINRGVANDGHTIRLPVHIQDQLRWNELPSAPDANDDARATAANGDIRAAAVRVMSGIWSLDAIRDLLENTSDPGATHDDPSEWVPERVTAEEAVRRALDSLDERSREVLERRSGMYGSPETLEEIGKRWRVTRERVRQVESKAESLVRARLWSFGADHRLLKVLETEPVPVRSALEQGLTFGSGLAQLAEVWEVDKADISRRIRAVLAAIG